MTNVIFIIVMRSIYIHIERVRHLGAVSWIPHLSSDRFVDPDLRYLDLSLCAEEVVFIRRTRGKLIGK